MSTQSGIFTFGEAAAILTQSGDGVWLGEKRRLGLSRLPSGLAGTFDGRIDNRDDLLRRLGIPSSDIPDDARLALAVVDRWGIDGLRWILGDWSLAVWDGVQRFHLARTTGAGRVHCVDSRASPGRAIGRLVTRTGRTEALSDGFAAGFMSLRLSPSTTPYNGVHAVPPGVCLSISSSGRVTPRRFWTLEAGGIRYPDPRIYEEQLYALWRDAVQARLRTDDTVWAELSGGLDSSSVVCMADLLVRRGDVPARAIRLVSHATLQSPEGDERRFIAEVERQVGVRSEIVGVEDNQEHTDPERGWVTPYALHGVGLETVRRVRTAGGRVVLSGRLGDAVMGCQPDNSVAVFDDLARGAAFAALRNLRAWSRASRKPFLEIAWKLFAPDAQGDPTPASIAHWLARGVRRGSSCVGDQRSKPEPGGMSPGHRWCAL